MTCPLCGTDNAAGAPTCTRCGQALGVDLAPPAPVAVIKPPFAPVTTALVAMNVLVFAAMALAGVSPMAPTTEGLLRWGADFGPAVTHGQWWRLLTSVFLHIGIVHIAMNMYVLWGVGRLMERLYGAVPFIVLYLLTGIAGSITSVVTHPFVVGAGASGAIFGLFGGLFGFLLVRRRAVRPEALQTLLRYGATFVFGNLVIGLSSPQIDLAAHLGGLLAGVPIGALLTMAPDAPAATRIARSAGVGIAGLVVAAMIVARIPVVDDWTAAMRRVGALESSSQQQFADAISKFQSQKMTAAEFSAVMDSKVLAPWEQQRQAILALRTDDRERAIAKGVAAYMADRADAWRLWATATLKNDGNASRQALSKEIEAAQTLESVMPTPGGAAQLARLLNQKAFSDEMTRFQSVESEVMTTLARASAGAAAGRLKDADFVNLIDTNVQKPWSDEQQRVSTLKPPPDKEEFVKGLLHYMSLESERFDLIAQALKKSDLSLFAKARAKQTEAEDAAKALSKIK